MNWQIIVGALLFIGGLANIAHSFGAFLFGIVVGSILIYWGLKKKGFDIFKNRNQNSTSLTPDIYSNLKRSYHYHDVNVWVKWQYSGHYGKSCSSIGMKRGDQIVLAPPKEPDDDCESISIYWKGIEVGHMKTNRLRSMVHQWQSAGLPVLAVVSYAGDSQDLMIEFAFYGSPKK